MEDLLESDEDLISSGGILEQGLFGAENGNKAQRVVRNELQDRISNPTHWSKCLSYLKIPLEIWGTAFTKSFDQPES